MEWMPIETAPKDKEIILGCLPDEDGIGEHVSQGYWIAAEEDQVDQPGHDAGFVDCNFCYWQPSRSFGAERSRYSGRQPTHWMPLPPPPKA
jgi:hypothetical protein